MCKLVLRASSKSSERACDTQRSQENGTWPQAEHRWNGNTEFCDWAPLGVSQGCIEERVAFVESGAPLAGTGNTNGPSQGPNM